MSGLLLAEKIRATTGLQGRERGVAGAVKLILLQLWNFGCSFGVVVSGLEYVTGFISLVDFFPFSPPPCPAPDMFLQKKVSGIWGKVGRKICLVFLPDSYPNSPFINFKNAQKC